VGSYRERGISIESGLGGINKEVSKLSSSQLERFFPSKEAEVKRIFKEIKSFLEPNKQYEVANIIINDDRYDIATLMISKGSSPNKVKICLTRLSGTKYN
jgi:hypothetical protein